jgi:hypothetical protein
LFCKIRCQIHLDDECQILPWSFSPLKDYCERDKIYLPLQLKTRKSLSADNSSHPRIVLSPRWSTGVVTTAGEDT